MKSTQSSNALHIKTGLTKVFSIMLSFYWRRYWFSAAASAWGGFTVTVLNPTQSTGLITHSHFTSCCLSSTCMWLCISESYTNYIFKQQSWSLIIWIVGGTERDVTVVWWQARVLAWMVVVNIPHGDKWKPVACTARSHHCVFYSAICQHQGVFI